MSSGASARRGLGRGLEVLIGGGEAGGPRARSPAGRRDPREPAPAAPALRARGDGGPRELDPQQGVLQPVVVRPRNEGGYELIAGERRWRAAREAGLATLPALVREADDRDTLLLALVENVAREQLSPVEEARAYASLVDEFELSLGDVAERVGRSKPAVSNRLRLLELPEEVLWMVARGELTEGHARAVLALPDHDERKRLAKRIVREGMSVRGAERAAQDGGAARRPRAATRIDPALAERAGRQPSASPGSRPRRGGKLELHFGDELDSKSSSRRSRRSSDWRTARPARRAPRGGSWRSRGSAGDRAGGPRSGPFRGLREESIRFRGCPSLAKGWAILDSNQGPPPYQSGALTN